MRESAEVPSPIPNYKVGLSLLPSPILTRAYTVGKFVLPKHGSTIVGESLGKYNSKPFDRILNYSLDDRYIRSRKEDMPPGHLFNEAYYPPHGKNGHVYHVFVSLVLCAYYFAPVTLWHGTIYGSIWHKLTHGITELSIAL